MGKVLVDERIKMKYSNDNGQLGKVLVEKSISK